MGILNVTPDSLSDGNLHASADAAVTAALEMAVAGADIIDIGAESTRPGRPETVSVEDEWSRLAAVLPAIRQSLPQVALSVDTYKGEVARRALEAGADIINDVYALRRSPEIAQLAVQCGAGLILMHMQGDPQTMQEAPSYGDVVVEIREMLRERMEFAMSQGVAEEAIALDPGIGFGKTLDHNLEILAGLEHLQLLKRPICIGVSRKGFLGKLTGGAGPADREEATIAANGAAILNGAGIVRVHNVRGGRRAADIVDAIRSRVRA